MEFSELAKTRYSLRKFSDKEIEKEKLDKVLEAARVAPTAVNFQPQRILVLNSKDCFEKMQQCTKYAFNAPKYLIICYDSDKSWKRDIDNKDYGETDAAIAATHIILQAAELGLGTCFVGVFDPTLLCESFNIPQSYIPTAIIPIGYPAEDAHPAHLHEKRLDISETVFYDKF